MMTSELIKVGKYEYFTHDALGQGSQGRVFRAKKIGASEEFAIKVIEKI